jgi:hypothetical protein
MFPPQLSVELNKVHSRAPGTLSSERAEALFAKPPRSEPYAVVPLVRFCARNRSAMVVPASFLKSIE